MPDVAAVAAELAELYVIAVWALALLEHKNQLVLAAVEGAHTGIVFSPDTEVFQLIVDVPTGREDL